MSRRLLLIGGRPGLRPFGSNGSSTALEVTSAELTSIVRDALAGQGWPAADVPDVVPAMVACGEEFEFGVPVRRWLGDLYVTDAP